MNSAQAFTYGMSGSYTEAQMQNHSAYVTQNNSLFKQAGGWLAEQAEKTMDSFNKFMDSRAWELSKRLLGQSDGDFVGRYDIGYLGSVNALQQSQGYMRDYIMGHRGIMQDYLDEQISGYEGDFNKLCFGVAEENIFYRRAMNGVLNLETVNDKQQLRHTQYHETLGQGLSFRERVDIHKTWNAIDLHRAKRMFDVTSSEGDKYKDYVEES